MGNGPADYSIAQATFAASGTDALARDDEAEKGHAFNRLALSEDVRRLSKVSGWRSLLAIAIQWGIIGCAVGACIVFHHWPVYVAAIVTIATRQHALGILMHEGAHYRLFQRRWVNDICSDILCGLPVGVSTSIYREHHFRHHRWVNTDRDPDRKGVYEEDDWDWPKAPIECIRVFTLDLLGFHSPMMTKILWGWSPLRSFVRLDERTLASSDRIRILAFYGVSMVAIAIAGGWIAWAYLAVFWLLPMLTVLALIFRVRALAEHYVVESENELNATRTVVPTAIERFLIAPCGINFHLEHHLFPSIPFFNLPEIHKLLMDDPMFRQRAHITISYFWCVPRPGAHRRAYR
jgi:fatty acid desaturase